MKIRFTFSIDKAELEPFKKEHKDQILIFICNPFKFGFGWKRRKLNCNYYIFSGYRIKFKKPFICSYK